MSSTPITRLLNECKIARDSENWKQLESLSIQVLREFGKSLEYEESNLKSIVQNYLASIVGSGDFLIHLKGAVSIEYQEGLTKLIDFLMKRPLYFKEVAPLLQAAQEIVLLSVNPTPANRNKIAKLSREISRPDIAILICKQVLDETRLNYYALTVLCGAYCDLSEFDNAIEAATLALKHSPRDGMSYPLNSLVRAHTLKFKSNGDLSEIEKAIEYSHQSLAIKVDTAAVNSYIAAAVASENEAEIENAKTMLKSTEPQLRTADIAAIIEAFAASKALRESFDNSDHEEETEDPIFDDLDSLFDLVGRKENFIPFVSEDRGQRHRYIKSGWFYQGASGIACPKCGLFKLNSYRKHFKRYGKELHYWAIVCNHCKTATDSLGIEDKVFESISKDLDVRHPLSLICPECD